MQNRLCMSLLYRLRKLGPSHTAWGAGTPRVWPHPGWLAWPPPLSGGLVAGPRPLARWFGTPICPVSGPFFFIPLRKSALKLSRLHLSMYFPLYSYVSPAK
jgi:hypothetical protein